MYVALGTCLLHLCDSLGTAGTWGLVAHANWHTQHQNSPALVYSQQRPCSTGYAANIWHWSVIWLARHVPPCINKDT